MEQIYKDFIESTIYPKWYQKIFLTFKKSKTYYSYDATNNSMAWLKIKFLAGRIYLINETTT